MLPPFYINFTFEMQALAKKNLICIEVLSYNNYNNLVY